MSLLPEHRTPSKVTFRNEPGRAEGATGHEDGQAAYIHEKEEGWRKEG